MKHCLIILFFVGIVFDSKAQNYNDEYVSDEGGLIGWNEFYLGISGNYVDYKNFAARTGYGINVGYSVHQNVILNWHLHFGRSYFSTSLWIPIGPLLFVSSASTGYVNKSTLGLLLISVLPDGVSFPIRVNDKIYITPSISPFWLDMFGRDPGYKRFYVSGNIGLGVQIKLKHFIIHPYAAGHLLYKSEPNTGYSVGLGIDLPLGDLGR